MIVWFTGVPGAGKSTLASQLMSAFRAKGRSAIIVDGDAFRSKKGTLGKLSRDQVISNNLNIIEHCKELMDSYDYIIVVVISPFQETRIKARNLLGKRYFEVFLECPREELIRRDPKGLYQKALNNEIDNLIGFSEGAPYERPVSPDIILQTAVLGPDESVARLINKLELFEKKFGLARGR